MALTTAEVTAVSRNSGTRRIREDTQGHDQGANQAQEDTGGAAGIRKDTTLGRFGTVRPRVQIPGPRPKSEYDSRSTADAARVPDHKFPDRYEDRNVALGPVGGSQPASPAHIGFRLTRYDGMPSGCRRSAAPSARSR